MSNLILAAVFGACAAVWVYLWDSERILRRIGAEPGSCWIYSASKESYRIQRIKYGRVHALNLVTNQVEIEWAHSFDVEFEKRHASLCAAREEQEG